MATTKARNIARIIGNDNKIAEDKLSAEIVLGPEQYATVDSLPLSGNQVGDQAFVQSTNRLYIWSGAGWYSVALINTSPAFDSGGSPEAAYSLEDSSDTVTITLVATDPEGVPITFSATKDSADDFVSIVQTTTTNTGDTFVISAKSLDSIIDAGYDSFFSGTFDITFTASDGVNLATALSEFTVTFFLSIVENSKYTTLLLKSVGENNGTNSNMIDASTNNYTITEYGNVHAGTFSPYRAGGYSYYFDGTGDYLAVQNSADLNFGSGDFTVEFWVRPDELAAGEVGLINLYEYASDRRSWYVAFDGTALEVRWSTTGTSADLLPKSADGVFEPNNWYHIAFVRNGSTVTGYVNGNSVLTDTISGTLYNNTQDPVIIGSVGTTLGGTEFKGYISDIRIVKGTAVYTSAFTPPTEPLTAITNTSFLACRLPYIKDTSSNDHSITINGNVSPKPFAPYDFSPYASSVNGGSISFDGTGDYLEFNGSSTLAFGTDDFTVEVFYRPDVVNRNTAIIDARPTNTSGPYLFLQVNSDDISVKANSWSLTAAAVLNVGVWVHIAVVRSSGTTTLYINGVAKDSRSDTTNYISRTTPNIGSHNYAGADLYGIISDLRITKGTAIYTSNFTPTTAPLSSNGAEFHLKGTDGSIIDYSGSRNIKLDGDTKSSTAVTKYGSSSIAFDGTGDRIFADEPLIPANEDFTYEAWLYLPSVSVKQAFVSQYLSTNSGRLNFDIGDNNSGQLNFFFAGTGVISSSAGAVSANTWHHVAYTREGNTFRGFLDGNLLGSATSSQAIYQTNTSFGVRTDLTEHYTGYMEDVRITRGLARYTANFTPPTQGFRG